MMKTRFWRMWFLAFCLFVVGGLSLSEQSVTAIVPSGFDCNEVTEIPVLECQALVALNNSIVENRPYALGTWLTSNTPCSWQGVTCENGNIIDLDLGFSPIPSRETMPSMDLSLIPPRHPKPNSLAGTNFIPPEIGNLAFLEGLAMVRMDLTSLPSEIGNLSNLEWLNLSYNELTSLPSGIGDLSNLSGLDLGRNLLTSLPTEIGNLSTLEMLDLNYNHLTSLPTEIGNLSTLGWLDLGYNQLTSLPPEIGNLSNLNSLILSFNQLTGLPSEIGNLSSLDNLTLQFNQLTNLPSEIFNLSNLERLDLNANQLTSLPSEIFNLSNLGDLFLGGNQLTSLPPEIGSLSNLSNLELGGNQLTSLPSEIGNLSNLGYLGLNYNQLTSLPSEIGDLSNLGDLGLGANHLTSLPPEIGNLSNLDSLILYNNQLTSLPPEIGNLLTLSYLNLTGNRLIGTLPPEISSITSLKFLFINGNRDLSGTIPLSFTNLGNLTLFWFYNTNICEPTEGPLYDWFLNLHSAIGTNIACAATTEDVDSWLSNPALVGASPGGYASIPIKYGNWGESLAVSSTLTVTLDSNLTFLSATPAPTTVMSHTLTWELGDILFWEQGNVTLVTAVPSATIGTRYPVSLTITSLGNEAFPANNSAVLEVMISHQLFLPVINNGSSNAQASFRPDSGADRP